MLIVDPLIEFPDGFALGREFDVGIERVNGRTCGVPHKRHADLLQDAGLHQARVEGVAKVMKSDMADTGVLQCGLPGALYDVYRLAVELDDEALGPAPLY